jgi:hypothetical protein
VTAATVRYLRYHHIASPEEMVGDVDPAELEEMMNSAQPEEFKDGTLYWSYLRQLVLRGCLEKAWIVLMRHSLFAVASVMNRSNDGEKQMAYDRDPIYFAKMVEIHQGFLQLKEIMLRAPLPGGRKEDYDDALGFEDRFDDGVEEADHFMEGLDVSPSDYKFWETEDASAPADYPVIYSAESAARIHRQWNDYVKNVRPSFQLSKRIRGIDSILAILSGDFTGVHFDSWAQKVCAELLYRHPDSRPGQISKRAKRIIEGFPTEDDNTEHISTILSIMEGDAARAIGLMYELGGAAGAALPATLVSSIKL